MARLRDRRRRGYRCFTIEVSAVDITALVAHGLIDHQRRDDPAAIRDGDRRNAGRALTRHDEDRDAAFHAVREGSDNNTRKKKMPETRYTVELAAAILKDVSEGATLLQVCRAKGIPEATVRTWARDDRENFGVAYAQARAMQGRRTGR